MLKQLTDSYYRLSTEAEALLQRAIADLRGEHAPSAEETQKINSALMDVHAAYHRVRDYAAREVEGDELPGAASPVSAYVAIISSKRKITEGILEDFLQAYAVNAHYEEPLKNAQQNAAQLLQAFRTEGAEEPDVAPYKAFVDGVKMGEALASDEGDRLLDLVETLGKKLARGLQGGYFALPEQRDEGEEPILPVESEPEKTDAAPAAEEEAVPAPEEPAAAGLPAGEAAQHPAENSVGAGEMPGEQTAPDEADETACEEAWVPARSRISTALPSVRKMHDALYHHTGTMVLDTIGTTHLINRELMEVYPFKKPKDYDAAKWLDSLESKGYLTAYEAEGETYYCPSPMLVNCIGKPERAKVLQDIRNEIYTAHAPMRKRKIPMPLLIGAEKIKRSTLNDCIGHLKTCIAFYKMKMALTFNWDEEEQGYLVSISPTEQAKEGAFDHVLFVNHDRYAERIRTEAKAVCACGDALPDADTMAGAAAESCYFYTDKLYRWENAWVEYAWKQEEAAEGSAPAPEEAPEEAPPAAEEHPEEHPEEQIADAAQAAETPVVPDAEAENAQPAAAAETVRADMPEQPLVVETPAAAVQVAGSAGRRSEYLNLAYSAYAQGRRGIGSAMMQALMQMHPDVRPQWRKWACASGDAAYTEGRNATRLQEIYPDADNADMADSALAVSAYIRMYFSNDAAQEYWVRSADAIASTLTLKRMNSLSELMQRLQSYVEANQCGINQATLVAMRQESGIEDQFAEATAKADEALKARLTETTVSNPRVKNLFELLFGTGSVMMDALRCICENRRGEARRIRALFDEIDPGLIRNSQQSVENWIEFLWHNSTRKMKGKNANNNIIGSARNSAVNRTKNVLGVISQWVELCIHNAELPERTIIAAAAEVKHLALLLPEAIGEVRACRAETKDDATGCAALLILEDTLAHFSALMAGESSAEAAVSNAEVADCSAMAVEEDGSVYIIPAEDMVLPYEQCEILAALLQEEPVTVEDAALRFVESAMANVDPTGGNFSNGQYLLACAARKYQPPLFAEYTESDYAARIRDAAVIVNEEEKKFHAHMEMAQAYGWFDSKREQERIERAVAAQCETYRIINDFSAGVACMKRTFNRCRQAARDVNHDALVTELNSIVASFQVEENNATIVRIRKLIEQDCYTAATAEIRKIHSDGRIEDRPAVVSEGRFDFFIQNFQTYYAAVSNVNTPLEAVFNTRNSHNRKGYVGSGREMLRAWPQSPEAINPHNVSGILTRMNLEVDSVATVGKNSEGHAAVRFKPRTAMDVVHPIADFGTNMLEGGLDVFYLAGNKTADQYFDMIRSQIGKGTEHAAVFFVNTAMSLSVRRQLTSKIWHELRSARPLLIFDRVLALYVAESEKIDRWNILLQCALPFTMVKPYTETSSAQQPPEMFVGRVQELRTLMAFGKDGANLLYGGRQLGKSAILYRVEQELHSEANATYVVFCSISKMDAAAAVRHLVVAMRRKNVPDAERIPLDASWADMCFHLNLILTEHPGMKLMLLIDEADILLGRDRETSYAALSEIKRVQDAFGSRFKFVFAGLHNVMRLHNEALDNNSDLPKLGSVNIKPLDYADAEELLKKPLGYMGFMFNESEEQQALISMILSTTNYYPGLIHYYCASLLNTFGDGHTEPAPTRPPYELDNKLILKLLQKEAFMEQTRQKFMMTLGIDKDEHQYYSILAYLMAYCYDENESRINGVSVEEICEAAETTDIAVISCLETSQVESLLDELCDLNILYSAYGAQPKRYVFSRPAFKEMLGTQDDVMEALLKYIDVEEVSQ